MKKKTWNCLSCDKENEFKGYSYANKYCDNKCQKDHEYRNYITEWKEGNITGTNKFGASKHIRRYVFEEQNNCCDSCGLDSWMGKSLVLELDHIDGDHTNNSEENLRGLCPNCHSQTDTYKNRNLGNGRGYRNKYYTPV